jgi:phosphopantetheinyl transferase (holo-ACP synthase)
MRTPVLTELHLFSSFRTGKPRAILAGQDKSIHTHISVSHDGDYAVAYAVIERV